jgi:hypothetical protein
VNGGEVKEKFQKAGIEIDDARRKQSGKKMFPEEQACPAQSKTQIEITTCRLRPACYGFALR